MVVEFEGLRGRQECWVEATWSSRELRNWTTGRGIGEEVTEKI